jgi:nucleotide-binding universal stress UspA family protein
LSRILIVVNANAAGEAALDAGLTLAKALDREVLFVHAARNVVVPLICESPLFVDAAAEQCQKSVQRDADRLLAAAARQARELGIVCDGAVVWGGDEAERIVHAAEDRRCDLIVVGSDRRTAIGRILRGSIAADLTAIASGPVLVVKAPAQVRKVGLLWKP